MDLHLHRVHFLVQKMFLASYEAFKKLRTSLPDICRGSNLELAVASSESFADTSRAHTVERHVLCAQIPMHLAESAAPSGSSPIEVFNKFRKQKLINNFYYYLPKILPLKLHSVASLSCQAGFTFVVEINEIQLTETLKTKTTPHRIVRNVTIRPFL